MQRAVNVAMVLFWAGVPLLAVLVAVSWPGPLLWWYLMGLPVLLSSAFLTLIRFPVEPERSEVQRPPEALAYPLVFFVLMLLSTFQVLPPW